ncbi:helix-turn-helix domain-containing protein [bacterium]|nr:helix-turn-helix domain-containing protein [bacterium]
MEQELSKLISTIEELTNALCEPKKVWLRTKEAERYLSISSTQLHILKKDGVLPFRKIGGLIYFKKEEIDHVLDSSNVEVSNDR